MRRSTGTWRISEHGGWPAFEAVLASVLAGLDDEQYLVDAIARLAVVTLADVRHVPSPRALVYRGFRSGGAPLAFPELRIPDEREPRPRRRLA